MPHIKDYTPDSATIQAVLMGDPGVGKTWLCGTFPRPNFLDIDKKVGVLRNPDFIKQYGVVDAQFEQFSDNKRLHGYAYEQNAYDDACRYFDSCMAPAKRSTFDSWIIDSGTSLIEIARNKALIVLGGMKMSGTHDKAMKHGLAVLQQQDWGGERSLTEQFIRMVRDSGKHVVVNVHTKTTTNENGIPVSIKPLFTGQSTDVVMAMFKDVWSLRVQGAGSTLKRILTAEFDGITAARSELGIGVIENPDFNKIMAAIKSKAAQAIAAAPTSPSDVSQLTTVAAKPLAIGQ